MIRPSCLRPLACCVVLVLALSACSDSDSPPSADLGDAGPTDGSGESDGSGGLDSQPLSGANFSVGASLGERLSYTFAPEALAYSYRIEDSDFGLEGTSGTGTLIANEDGTFTPSGAPQARLIYIPQTLLIGAETIQLAGQDRLLLFAGVPARKVAYLPGEAAGLFNFTEYSCDKTMDQSCGPQAYFTSHGTVEVAANGTFTLCKGGDLGDVRTAPCTMKVEGDWVDEGDGVLSISAPGDLEIGQGMLLPSSQGGKMFVLDLKDTSVSGPGLLVAVQRVSLVGVDLAGKFHFVGDDGNHGMVEVDSARDTYHGTKQEPGLEPLAYQGTFIRDAPWPGWLTATDDSGGQSTALVLPDVGAWINSSLPNGNNTWIDIGARLE